MEVEQGEKYVRGTRVECLIHYDDASAFVQEGTYQGKDRPKFLGGFETHKITLANGDIVYDCEVLYGLPGATKEICASRTKRPFSVIRDEKGIYRGFTPLDGTKKEAEATAPAKEPELAPQEIKGAKNLLEKLFAK